MRDVSTRNFGLLIAYLLPGFTTLWGLSYVSDTIRSWLGSPPTNSPTVGGFLYVTLASIALGLTASTIRWLIIDRIHHWTGVPRPRWDFSRLQANVAAFETLVEIHYRYTQFYGGALVSLTFVYLTRRVSLGFWSTPFASTDLGFLMLAVVFFLGSRDTFRKYVVRGNMLLREPTRPERDAKEDADPDGTPAAGKRGAEPLDSTEKD